MANHKPYNVRVGYTFLRSHCIALKLTESMQALDYAMQAHYDDRRKSGELYITHPLRMANHLLGLGVHDDHIIATALLHDVPEDKHVPLDSLPVGKDTRKSVGLLTLPKVPDEDRLAMKRLYFERLLESRAAALVKAADRYDNLVTMEGALSEEQIIHNVKETNDLLLPVLARAGHKWSYFSQIFQMLSDQIEGINDTLALVHGVELYPDMEATGESTLRDLDDVLTDFAAG